MRIKELILIEVLATVLATCVAGTAAAAKHVKNNDNYDDFLT